MQRQYFGTDGIRGIANKHPMTAEMALQIGKAVAHVLRNGKERPKIVIGKDTRLSGYMFESALTSGICSMGGDVLLVGPMPTPAIAHLTKSFAADAGIVISASHNPSDHNGIKIFSKDGFKLDDSTEYEIEELLHSEKLRNNNVTGDRIGKARRIDDAKGRYTEFVKASIKNYNLTGLRIVLDCSHGAAYHITPQLLAELGAEVITLCNQPDGLNINRDCGSLHPELIKKSVLENKLDVGIALDGDADRVIMVDEKGNEVDGDHIMAVIALSYKNEGRLKKDTVVATVMTNKGFEIFMEKNGITTVRTKVGDPYVVEEMVRNGYNLGGEQSGHIVLMDHTTAPDATVTALHILKIMKETGKRLSELSSLYKALPQILINENVKEKKEIESMPEVMAAIKEAEAKLADKGRVLVRYSGTENKVRVMVEGEDYGAIKDHAENIMKEIITEIGCRQ
ncbi:MAG: phosphoglucosamine mutase [Candidatus Woesearchaeota archaeon]